jgi:sortase A
VKKTKKLKIKPLDIVMATVLLAGLCVLLYPFVGNAISKYQQHLVIAAYNRKIDTQTAKDTAVVDKWIRENNQALKPTDQPVNHGALIDPFTVNKKDSQKKQSDLEVLKEPGDIKQLVSDVVGVLDIPKIDTTVPIYNGTTAYQLQRGAGLVKGTSIPFAGVGVHSVIAGHRGLPTSTMFRHLDNLKIGDYFFVTSNKKKYAYKVDEVKVVEPKQVTNFKVDKDKNYVTLMTCTPYMINTHRLLVRGHQVPMVKVPRGWPWWLNYAIALAVILAAVISRYLYLRHKRHLKTITGSMVDSTTPQK